MCLTESDSHNNCQKKKKKQLQVIADSAPKASENFYFSLLAAATDLKCQVQTHLLISQRRCENKFLQKINHFPPGSILLPELPQTLQGPLPVLPWNISSITFFFPKK